MLIQRFSGCRSRRPAATLFGRRRTPRVRAEVRSEALTTAIAAGLIGLSAPAVDAPPPGPTGPPGDRGFARALDRATAPPSEASPTQGSPPPETAVAEPAGNASHEAGTAASDAQQSPRAGTAASSDDATTVAEMSQELTSMPDRPAGAVEGAQDTVALETSALEAMMAAVLFRPAPVPQQVDVASASAAASAGDQAGAMSATSPAFGVMPATSETSISGQPDLAAAAESSVAPHMDGAPDVSEASASMLSAIKPTMIARDAGAAAAGAVLADNAQTDDSASLIELSAITPDAVGEAMRVATQGVAARAGQRPVPTRGKGTDVAREGNVMSESDVEAMSATMGAMGSTDDGTASAVTPPVNPAETASMPLSLIEGMSDVEAVEVFTSTVRADMRTAVPADDAEPADAGDNVARAGLTSGLSPMTDADNTVPVAAAKARGVQSLPVAAQVAETVRSAVLRGDHEIRLLLNPGDMGRIDIRITEQNGVLQLNLNASHGSTRDLLAREMPVLQQALEARDLRVERIQVSHSGSASSDGSGAAWQQGFGRQGQQQEGRDGSPAWSPVASLTPSGRGQQEAHRAPRVIRHHGVLDRVA